MAERPTGEPVEEGHGGKGRDIIDGRDFQIPMGKEKNRDEYPGQRRSQDIQTLDKKELALVGGQIFHVSIIACSGRLGKLVHRFDGGDGGNLSFRNQYLLCLDPRSRKELRRCKGRRDWR